MDAGPCGDRYDRWHYDPQRSTCMPFIYGGCAGNMNRFKSFESCLNFCSPSSASSRPASPPQGSPSNPYGSPSLHCLTRNNCARFIIVIVTSLVIVHPMFALLVFANSRFFVLLMNYVTRRLTLEFVCLFLIGQKTKSMSDRHRSRTNPVRTTLVPKPMQTVSPSVALTASKGKSILLFDNVF